MKLFILLLFLFVGLNSCQPDGIKFSANLQNKDGKLLPVVNTEFRVFPAPDSQVKGVENFSFTTDPSGKAVLKLVPGTWLFSGEYSSEGQKISWMMLPVQVDEKTKTIELNSANGVTVSTEMLPGF